jgi:hypothetical protein
MSILRAYQSSGDTHAWRRGIHGGSGPSRATVITSRRSSYGRQSGGRTWWAHFEITRMNIEPIILRKNRGLVRGVRLKVTDRLRSHSARYLESVHFYRRPKPRESLKARVHELRILA